MADSGELNKTPSPRTRRWQPVGGPGESGNVVNIFVWGGEAREASQSTAKAFGEHGAYGLRNRREGRWR